MEIVAEKFQLLEKIGQGSFGTVHKGRVINSEVLVAIKLEKRDRKISQLRTEDKILRVMAGTPGFPKRYWFGTHKQKFALVMEYLGKSLDNYLSELKSFTLKTVCVIALQTIDRLEALHNKCFLHRDMKPANMMMCHDFFTLYLIDFGLSKLYKDINTQQHILYKEGKQLTGTARYVSLATHNGVEQSRRDDLESLFYICINFLVGNLPWCGIRRKKKFEKHHAIHEVKTEYTIEKLCKDLPREITIFGNYIRSVRFEMPPDYNFLRNLFYQISHSQKFQLDNQLDWLQSPYKKASTVKVPKKRKRRKKQQHRMTVQMSSNVLSSCQAEQGDSSKLSPVLSGLSGSGIVAEVEEIKIPDSEGVHTEECEMPSFSPQCIKAVSRSGMSKSQQDSVS